MGAGAAEGAIDAANILFNVLKVMADHRLDALVYKSIEHQPRLITEVLANAPQQAAQEKAAALAAKMEMVPFEWDGRHVPLRVAHGAYSFTGGEDAAKALAEADKAMYERKQSRQQADGE